MDYSEFIWGWKSHGKTKYCTCKNLDKMEIKNVDKNEKWQSIVNSSTRQTSWTLPVDVITIYLFIQISILHIKSYIMGGNETNPDHYVILISF